MKSIIFFSFVVLGCGADSSSREDLSGSDGDGSPSGLPDLAVGGAGDLASQDLAIPGQTDLGSSLHDFAVGTKADLGSSPHDLAVPGRADLASSPQDLAAP